MRYKQAVVRLVLVVGFMIFSTAQGSQKALDDELNEYIAVFSGDNFAAQRTAIEPLGWSGISDSRLFDVIADKLMTLLDGESKVEKERASWFAKALALSGNEKYQGVLENVAENASAKKVRKHATTALQRLPRYVQWNPIIAAGLNKTQESLAVRRIKNMLAAKQVGLFRLGAKRVYHAHASNEELVGLVKEKLISEYQLAKSGDDIDAMAWAIKVLAQSGDASHKPLLTEIAESAKQKKIRKYAKKYASYL